MIRIFHLLWFFPSVFYAQNAPDLRALSKIELEKENVDIQPLCRPGIINKSRARGLEFSYTLINGGRLKEDEAPILPAGSELQSVENLTFKVKVPILLKDKFKVLAGYSYGAETYSFSRIGPNYSDVFRRIDNYTLQSNSFALYASSPINQKYYTGFKLETSFNGDYKNWGDFSTRYLSYKASGLLGVKESDDLEWGLGVYYSHSFRNTTILPFLMYNRNFNDRWGLEALFPAVIMGRYNINPKSLLLFGTEFNSRSYALDVKEGLPSPTHFHMNHAELRLLLRLERQLVPWIWFNAEGGYQFNFNTEFEDKTTGLNSFRVDPVSNLFFKVGVFLSPPNQ